MSEALIDRPMMSQLITAGAIAFFVLSGWAIWKSVKLYRSIKKHRVERQLTIQRLRQPL